MGVRRVGKEDIRRIAAATGGTILPNLADLEGEESFNPEYLGDAESVSEEKVGDNYLIYLRGCRTTRATSIVLRGANEFMLDEMQRSLHDSLCVVKRVMESRTLVVGGGGVEAALSVYLDAFSTTLGTREQLAIKEVRCVSLCACCCCAATPSSPSGAPWMMHTLNAEGCKDSRCRHDR